ncbi:MmyB family transcriptional regulator [Streptomyces sp. NPDC055140]
MYQTLQYTETSTPLATREIEGIRNHRLHEFIKSRREHLGLTMDHMARRLEMTSRGYSNWEHGITKQWTEEKLRSLGEALELPDPQLTRLFWLAVGRPPQPGPLSSSRHTSTGADTHSPLLRDYTVLLNALSLPSFVVNHRWEVQSANSAYRDLFTTVRPHPTAMPAHSLCRFALFHPDAPDVLIDHRQWQLAMLAHLAAALERHGQDPHLQAMRREVYMHPSLRNAFLDDVPRWTAGVFSAQADPDVRRIRTEDPLGAIQTCRIVEENERSLELAGFSRVTLVLTPFEGAVRDERQRTHDHSGW